MCAPDSTFLIYTALNYNSSSYDSSNTVILWQEGNKKTDRYTNKTWKITELDLDQEGFREAFLHNVDNEWAFG